MSQRAFDFLPLAVRAQLTSGNYASYARRVAQYQEMSDADLLHATQVCLSNLEYVDDMAESADVELRVLLVPEMWERIRPRVRDRLRRSTSTIAEWRAEDSPPFWRRLLGEEAWARLAASADRVRAQIATTKRASAAELVERARFAVAGSEEARRHPPWDCLYGPGFAYQVVPVLALRVLDRAATVRHTS